MFTAIAGLAVLKTTKLAHRYYSRKNKCPENLMDIGSQGIECNMG